MTHWLQNTVGSHEMNRLIFKRPAHNPVGDAKTVTSSEFPAYRGTKIQCIRGESPRNPPLRPEWGGGVRGFQVKQFIIAKRDTLVAKHCWQP